MSKRGLTTKRRRAGNPGLEAMEGRCLVLNSWMQPHSIMSWQQAVTLMYQEKADVLETYEATVSSPSMTIQLPAVMRLRKEVAMHKKGVKFSRINVLTRDKFTCCYCGNKFKSRELNYDHVLPRCQGGKTVWDNIVTSCVRCNSRKGNRTPAQAGMRMHFHPHRPKILPMGQPLLYALDSVPAQWQPYLDAARVAAG